MIPRRDFIRDRQYGYSLIEMMMTLAIGLILVGVALPMLYGAIQSYRLNSVAQQTASLIELARYSAIRRNSVVSLLTTTQNGNTVFFIDLDGDGALDANEPLVMLPSDIKIANAASSLPDPASTGINNTQNFAGTITFDYRGTVNFPGGGATGAYFLALAYVNPDPYGFRAITLIPMGQTRVWKAVAGGPWTGM
jgi:type IV fimbrial biogenesis protein FimT